MPDNESPDRSRSEWVEGWQRQERQREQNREQEKRKHLLFTLAIVVGIPLLLFLFCCGIFSFRSPRSTTFHTKD
jgi:hypothetical protein